MIERISKYKGYPDVFKEKKKNCSNQSTETYMFSINHSIFIDTHTYTHCIVHLQYLNFFLKDIFFKLRKMLVKNVKLANHSPSLQYCTLTLY